MNHKQRVITGVGLAAGLVAGGGAGLILGASGSAGASPFAVVAATDPPTTDSGSTAPTGTATPPPPTGTKTDRADRLRQLLQSLVDDGTLTQAQVDAVIAKLDTAGPVGAGAPGPGGTGFGGRGFGGGRGMIGIGLDTVASTLGVTVDELRTALRDGTTIAAYAVTKGKTAQDVIDALVAAAKTDLAAKVTAGTITQAEADTKLAAETTEITEFVNNGTFPGRGGPNGGDRTPGERRGKRDATGTTPAPATPAAPSTADTPPTSTTSPTTTPSTTPVTTGS